MINKGDQFEALVHDLGASGDGIVEHGNGQVFFVPGAWVGERVKVRVESLKSNFGHAKILEVVEPSSHRIDAPCKYHGFSINKCGGCPWGFVAYDAQLKAKQARVVASLTHINVRAADIRPIVASANPIAYRNRAQLKTDGTRLGYVASKSRQLVDVQECLVLNDALQTSLANLRQALPNKNWQPKRKNDWLTLDIDDEMAGHSLNQRLPFKQGNTQQNEVMREWLKNKLDVQIRSSIVMELFAGAGNFTELIASLGFEKIIAVEAVESAIKALAARKLAGVEAVTQNLYVEGAYKYLFKKYRPIKALILDPPRDGLKNADELIMHAKKLQDIFYISCDLATFTRDAKAFLAAGYNLVEVQPVDLFPQTPHVELLAHFQRRRS